MIEKKPQGSLICFMSKLSYRQLTWIETIFTWIETAFISGCVRSGSLQNGSLFILTIQDYLFSYKKVVIISENNEQLIKTYKFT